VQDPGNVGTVIRTAAALGTELVILVGGCADPFGPKAVRAAMGALFRQRVLELDLAALSERLRAWDLPLFGAALSASARDLRESDVSCAAVAVGNEGRGLSDAMLSLCEGEIIIPMAPGSESLNAAVAAAVVMWEARRNEA
jgi:TrmH family RNA methyltransferase